jgi:hypothetical protein
MFYIKISNLGMLATVRESIINILYRFYESKLSRSNIYGFYC